MLWLNCRTPSAGVSDGGQPVSPPNLTQMSSFCQNGGVSDKLLGGSSGMRSCHVCSCREGAWPHGALSRRPLNLAGLNILRVCALLSFACLNIECRYFRTICTLRSGIPEAFGVQRGRNACFSSTLEVGHASEDIVHIKGRLGCH